MKEQVLTATIEQPVSELNQIRGKYQLRNNRKTWLSRMSGNKDGRDLHIGTFTMYTPEIDYMSKSIITGIPNGSKLQVELEEALNLQPKTLSPYNREYWAKYFIKIPAEGLFLDCDRNIIDKLNYLILRASTKIYSDGTVGCKSKAGAEWLLISPEAEKAKESKQLDTTTQAYAKLAEMSMQERMDFLKVYEEGKYAVNNTSKPDFINAAIKQVVENNPAAFLETFKNPFYKTAVFLKDCMAIKAVIKNGPAYYVNGGEKIGNSYLQTLQNLQSDDWQEIKISLLGKLEAHK